MNGRTSVGDDTEKEMEIIGSIRKPDRTGFYESSDVVILKKSSRTRCGVVFLELEDEGTGRYSSDEGGR